MKRLLLNADDYGLHPLINEAVETGVERRALNSVSVMTNAAFADYSVLKNFQRNGVFVGCHLSLVRSAWLTENINIFGWKEFRWRMFIEGKAFLARLKKEAASQIELLLANGILPDHLDSHQHVHHFPSVWNLVDELRSQFNIKRVRCCQAPIAAPRKNGISGWMLHRYAGSVFDLQNHYYTAGLKHAGNYSFEKFETELAAAGNGDVEFILHPAINTAVLEKIYPDWKFDWGVEFQTLMDTRLLHAISKCNFYMPQRNAE